MLLGIPKSGFDFGKSSITDVIGKVRIRDSEKFIDFVNGEVHRFAMEVWRVVLGCWGEGLGGD